MSRLVRAGAFYMADIDTPSRAGTARVTNMVSDFTTDSAFTNQAGMVGKKETTTMSSIQLVVPNNQFNGDLDTKLLFFLVGNLNYPL